MAVRQPRVWVSVNGAVVEGMDCSVHLTRLSHGSEFEATLALDDPPGAGFWSDTAPISASIVATDGINTNTLMTGDVYKVDIDWEQRTVRITANDATTSMANSRNDQKYQNLTTSQVVQQIAGNHGLIVQTDGTGDQAGRTFNNQEYAFNSDAESDLDVVRACAEQEGKVCFIDAANKILHFVDPGNVLGSEFVVTYVPPTPDSHEQGNVVKLATSRDVQLGLGVQGQAASWNTRDKKAYNSSTETN